MERRRGGEGGREEDRTPKSTLIRLDTYPISKDQNPSNLGIQLRISVGSICDPSNFPENVDLIKLIKKGLKIQDAGSIHIVFKGRSLAPMYV